MLFDSKIRQVGEKSLVITIPQEVIIAYKVNNKDIVSIVINKPRNPIEFSGKVYSSNTSKMITIPNNTVVKNELEAGMIFTFDFKKDWRG